MNIFQRKLIPIFEKENYIHKEDSLPLLHSQYKISEQLKEDISTVYSELSGIPKNELPFQITKPTLEFKDLAITIDTEKKFNRYRKSTLLDSSIYEDDRFSFKSDYMRYCRLHEKDCIRAASGGNDWQNKSSNYYFGKSESPGDLGLNGSSNWKLVAFLDYLMDLSSVVYQYKHVRLSVYDRLMIKGATYTLKDLLMTSNQDMDIYLYHFIKRKF